MTVPAMVAGRNDDAWAAIIVVVAVIGAIVRGPDADAYAARSGIEANLRHRGGCRRKECHGRNNTKCKFSHESLLSLLKQINAEARGVVPQSSEVF
jgi:hypothetical protein